MRSTALPQRRGLERRSSSWMRWLRMASLMLFTPLVLVGCQSSLIYFPRPYPPETQGTWVKETGGRIIDYRTSQGAQRAFLQGNLRSPRNLWVACGGNGSLALDWADWLALHGPAEDAFLLVDFPGYGDCEGAPNPARIRESFRTLAPLAWQELGEAPDPGRLRFFGHSLGAAACLIAASELGIRRGVLLAPFTSTMEMSREVTGLPLGFLVTHRFDNRARLRELAGNGGRVIIVHGTSDEVIPFRMARQLAADQPAHVELVGISGGRHNTIPETDPETLAEALKSAR